MLPRATATRTPREVSKGRPSGRTLEIQRLIGRSLRTVVDTAALGDRTVIVDCDVLQADGGTRTASITGAYVALVLALQKLVKYGTLKSLPITQPVAATSVGILRGEPLLDLCYEEDSSAEVDMNLVMTGSGRFVELQATAEKTPFDDGQLEQMVGLARRGIAELFEIQKAALALETGVPVETVLRHHQSRQAARVSNGAARFHPSGCASRPGIHRAS